jgi:hypothetical protein
MNEKVGAHKVQNSPWGSFKSGWVMYKVVELITSVGSHPIKYAAASLTASIRAPG